jgi:hypothetical protein
MPVGHDVCYRVITLAPERNPLTEAFELRKAGALCRSNLVLVLDETGRIIFNCWVRSKSHTPPVPGKWSKT